MPARPATRILISRRRVVVIRAFSSFKQTIMQFIAILLAAASVAFAQNVPTLSAYNATGCSGTPAETWSGVSENAFCEATPGANSLNIAAGASNCEIDLYTTSNCNGASGGFITTVPDVNSCFTAGEEFGSVRIVCISGG